MTLAALSWTGPMVAALVFLCGASAAMVTPARAAGADHAVAAQVAENKSKTTKRKPTLRRVKLAPVFKTHSAFGGAPPPRFQSLHIRTTASDGSHREDTRYTLLEGTGTVVAVSETSESAFRNLDGKTWRQELKSDSRYVLGGLLFVEGEWSGIREDQDGLREVVDEGADTLDFTRIAGRLFPLAVGNTLFLAYRSRIKRARDFADNEVAFRVVREGAARDVDPRLEGKVFVIEAVYKETYADETNVAREEIHYAPSLGWPVLQKRRDESFGADIESRLVGFSLRRKK